MTGGFSDSQLFKHYGNVFPINSAQTSLNLILLPVMGYNYLPSCNFLHIIVCLYKGKGDALDRDNYRGLKLAEQAMKILERLSLIS